MPLRLIEPSAEYLEAFLRFGDEVRHAEQEFASVDAVQRDGWAEYLARLAGMRDGSVQNRSGVPMSTYWLLAEDGELLGVSRLRHRLTPSLREYGGHIGFGIRPSARRNGFGVELLSLTLDRACELGIERAMLTCDSDNAGSCRIIERCGGALDAEYIPSQSPVLIRRYWIDLGGASEEVR